MSNESVKGPTYLIGSLGRLTSPFDMGHLTFDISDSAVEVHAVLQKLLVSVRVDVVFSANVLFQAGAFAKHQSRVKGPGFGENVGVFHGDVVINLVFIHAREAFGCM